MTHRIRDSIERSRTASLWSKVLFHLEAHGTSRLLLLVVAALASRVVFLLQPGPIILGWRPTDMASIALNYYRNGFHFLSPQVNWGGNGPGYVETEFPIIPFLTAGLYRFFGIHEWLTLVIPLASGLGLVIVVYLLCRRLFGGTAGFAAGLFTAISPTLSCLTTSLWPDPPMIFFGALGIYALTLWVSENTRTSFLVGAVATSLAILLKLTALYLGIPILYLCVLKYGLKVWKVPIVWLLGILILLPVVVWYWHAYTLYLEYHNTFGILSGGYSKFATAAILVDPTFYGDTLLRIVMYHLTPCVFAVFVYGMVTPGKNPLRYVAHVWAGAAVLSFLVAARGAVDGHYQYVLPIVPPAAVLAGFGTVLVIKKLQSWSISRSRLSTVYSMLAFLFLAGVASGESLYRSRDRFSTPGWENDQRTGLAVGRVTAPGSLIVVVDTQMDAFTPETSMTPPNVFYFSDRYGWYVSLGWLNQEWIEQLRVKGARYLAVTANAESAFQSSAVRSYLSAHYHRVLRSDDGIVYDLAVEQRAVPTGVR